MDKIRDVAVIVGSLRKDLFMAKRPMQDCFHDL